MSAHRDRRRRGMRTICASAHPTANHVGSQVLQNCASGLITGSPSPALHPAIHRRQAPNCFGGQVGKRINAFPDARPHARRQGGDRSGTTLQEGSAVPFSGSVAARGLAAGCVTLTYADRRGGGAEPLKIVCRFTANRLPQRLCECRQALHHAVAFGDVQDASDALCVVAEIGDASRRVGPMPGTGFMREIQAEGIAILRKLESGL